MSFEGAAATGGGAGSSRAKVIFGTGVGNALEWYDWGVYATFASYLGANLFSKADPVAGVLATLAVFAVGFAARPLGGFLFGWLADRRGRKVSMALAVGAGSLGSLIIGFIPSYASVGAFASLLLVIARLIQGLAHGGELPSSQTYISEYAPAHKRGLWSSLIYISGTCGSLFGVLLGAILSSTLNNAQMNSFGWRIPFIFGGVAGLYALYMRSRMTETSVYTEESGVAARASKPKVWPEIVKHRKQALQVIGMTAGLTVVFYAWGVSAPAYAISTLGVKASHALWAGVVANVVFIAVLPLWGMLSDRVGRKPVLLAGAIGIAVLLFPLNGILGHSAVALGVTMSVALILLGASSAIVPAVYSELFPTNIRAVGVGIPYSICIAIFGGTAPYLQTWIGERLGREWFLAYVTIILIVSIVVISTLPETNKVDLRMPVFGAESNTAVLQPNEG